MMKISEEERLSCISETDRSLWEKGLTVCGMDEVGRGPLAGPVTVCAIILPPEPLIPFVNDSKKLTEKRRLSLDIELRKIAREISIAWVEPEIIDQINILNATRLCFENAFNSLNTHVDDVMIDALSGLTLNADQHVIIHGDALCYSIAAASIIAKVARDKYMTEQDEIYPQYGFARNKGYGTAEHIEALKKYGPCPLHRRSFIKHFL